jgi:hypothetical protein
LSILDTALLLAATAAFVVAPMLFLIIIGIVDCAEHIKTEAKRKSIREQQELQERINLLEADAPDYESWLRELHFQVDRDLASQHPSQREPRIAGEALGQGDRE